MRRVLLVFLLVLIVGCSAGGEVDDGSLARSSVVTAADLGRGWRAVEPPKVETVAEHCPGFHQPTGTAHSPRFIHGQATVDSAVAVWVDEAAAQRELRQSVAEPTLRCVEGIIARTAKRATPKVDEVDVHVSRASVRGYGDARAGVDAVVSVVRGSDVRTYHLATVFVRSGRTLVQFSFGDWPEPAVPDGKVIDAVLRRVEGQVLA
ncbi:MAG: hypothetical protein JWN67_1945 [Actinomycetia bacterium]|nr:hypothetical protein [Actinomycetes bacterium]